MDTAGARPALDVPAADTVAALDTGLGPSGVAEGDPRFGDEIIVGPSAGTNGSEMDASHACEPVGVSR